MIQSQIDNIIMQRQTLMMNKKQLETEINRLDEIIKQHFTSLVRQIQYPKIGEFFYWKDYDGNIRKNMCYNIDTYDREGEYDPCYMIQPNYGRGCMVAEDRIVGLINVDDK